MRFVCKQCNGVFFLESTKPIPCPACMSMLTPGEEEASTKETLVDLPGDDLDFDAMLAAAGSGDDAAVSPELEAKDTIAVPGLPPSLQPTKGSGATISTPPPPPMAPSEETSETNADVFSDAAQTQSLNLPPAPPSAPEAPPEPAGADAGSDSFDDFLGGVTNAITETQTALPKLGSEPPPDDAGVTQHMTSLFPPPDDTEDANTDIFAGVTQTIQMPPRPSDTQAIPIPPSPSDTQAFPPPTSPSGTGSFPPPRPRDTVKLSPSGSGSFPPPPHPSSRRTTATLGPGATQAMQRPPTGQFPATSGSGRFATSASQRAFVAERRQRSMRRLQKQLVVGVAAIFLALTVVGYFIRKSRQEETKVAEETPELEPVVSAYDLVKARAEAESKAGIAEAGTDAEGVAGVMPGGTDATATESATPAVGPGDAPEDVAVTEVLPADEPGGDEPGEAVAGADEPVDETPGEAASEDAPAVAGVDESTGEPAQPAEGEAVAAADTPEQPGAEDAAEPTAVAEEEGTTTEEAPADVAAVDPSLPYPQQVLALFAEQGEAAIEAKRLDKETRFELAYGHNAIDATVSPGGYAELAAKRPAAKVEIEGADSGFVELFLRPGERISFRPAAKIDARVDEERLSLKITATDWAYTLRAEDVRDNGVPVLCDDMACLLKDGQQLDTKKLATRVTFMVSNDGERGRLVKLLASTSSTRKKASGPASETRKPRAKAAPKQVTRGVFDGRSRDLPWQSVSLPTISR